LFVDDISPFSFRTSIAISTAMAAQVARACPRLSDHCCRSLATVSGSVTVTLLGIIASNTINRLNSRSQALYSINFALKHFQAASSCFEYAITFLSTFEMLLSIFGAHLCKL
jgi:hypothetical protein